ncbi:MAG: DUF3604 domain-containing protein [Chloroflexota bacterium]
MEQEDRISDRLGTIKIEPQAPAVAGSYGTWTLTYTVGSYGLDSGGQVKVAYRWVSDWEAPQFDRPQESGYTTVVTNGEAKLGVSWQPRGYIRPWTACLVIDVYDGSLAAGDTITIILGDKQQGSPGIRAQSYQESRFEFRTLVDPTNAADPRRLPTSPEVAIVPAPMTDLVCILPSQIGVDETADIFVKGEDEWRNPTSVSQSVHFEWQGEGQVKVEDGKLTGQVVGTGYLIATSGSFTCRSNPMQIVAQSPAQKRYWGDIHAQTAETVGVGTEDEYFTFGRDAGRLDFTSHQGNDFQISDEFWSHLNDITDRYHEEGKFVVLYGYEWSANTPAGGDHNVFYRRKGQPILRSSHWLVPQVPENDLTPANPAPVFYERLKANVPRNDVLVCAHVGGRYANLRTYFDQDLVGLVELVSCWGVFEWMLWDALERDYIVGVMCNSDGHHGRPGAEGAGMADFGIRNGLTCVLADDLTRDSVFDALKQRACYGTTGARILLDFSANGHHMGRVIHHQSDLITINASVTGTAPLESLQLYQGQTLLKEVRPTEFDNLTASNLIRISWQGSRERGRQRRVTWDGELRLKGCQIESIDLFSFDVVADGVVSQTADKVVFRSRTTGDRDGLDLLLADSCAGMLIFDSAAGNATVNLADLTTEYPRQVFDFGGVDMQLVIERYPSQVSTLNLSLTETITPELGKLTPYFVKATQLDGEMAWASPIYVDNREPVKE